MMSQTLEGQRLQASFTFRIVKAIKDTKINPMPRTSALPWGLSLAAGIIFTVMTLSTHLDMLNPPAIPAGSPLPSQAKALKAGEVPVDVLDVPQMPLVASREKDGDSIASEMPNPQKLLLAPQVSNGKWISRSDMPTASGLLAACSTGGKVYAIGGGTDWPVPISAVQEYEPVTNSWNRKADMPSAKAWLSASAVNGKIYVIGGVNRDLSIVSTVDEYDPVTDALSTDLLERFAYPDVRIRRC